MWCDETQRPFLNGLSIGGLSPAFYKAAVDSRLPVILENQTRGCGSPMAYAVMLAALKNLPNAWTIKEELGDERSCVIISPQFILEMSIYEDTVALGVLSMGRDIASKIHEIINCLPEVAATPDAIYVIVQSRDGLVLTRVGEVGLPVVPENYSADNFKQYTHVAADLLAADPCGRLTIMSGEPGTGKTFLVRALVNAAKGATFVMVPPHMIPSLGDPGLVNLLIDHKESHTDQPLIMVLEDADSVLVPRQADNMHAISGLLNLSDGLLGRALDIRIIATTNALIEHMDEALTRPGRLCRHITTGALPQAQVEKLCEKLGPGRPVLRRTFDGGATLAQIYKWAKDPEPVTTKARAPRGFNPNRS